MRRLAAIALGLLWCAQGSAGEAGHAALTLEASLECELRDAVQSSWGLTGDEAAELLALLAGQGIHEPRIEAALWARIGGHEAARIGLALMSQRQGDETLDRIVTGDLEWSHLDYGRAIQLYRQAERQSLTPEEEYHISAHLTEAYLFHTGTVERALPYLRKAIGLAHELRLQNELEHLQELQQLFALQSSRLKARPDALRFSPVESYSGLLGSEARHLVRQGNGLWILDSGGAIYFNGLQWKAYPSQEPFGWAALLGSDGAFYATPRNGGLARLFHGHWSFLEQPRGYDVNRNLALLEEKGWLYLARDASLARIPLGGGLLEEIELQPKPTTQSLGLLRQLDRLDKQLLATFSQGVLQGNEKEWKPLETHIRLPDAQGMGFGRSVVDGNSIWLPTTEGIYRWSPEGTQRYTLAEGLPATAMSDVFRTSDGQIFGGSQFIDALARFDGEAWQSATDPMSVLDLESMPDGLFLATEAGLFRGKAPYWRVLDSRLGLPGDQLEYVFQLGDELWIAAQTAGITRVAPGEWKSYGSLDGLPPLGYFLSMARRASERWVGTDHGLFRLDGEHFTPVVTGIPALSGEIFSLLALPEGDLLIGSLDGLYQMNPDGGLRRIETPAPAIRAMLQTSQRTILAATEGAGVVVLELSASGEIHAKRGWGKEQGLCSDQAQALWADPDGTVWIGTDSGLAVHRRDSLSWSCLTEEQGLPGHDITGLLRLKSGLLAVAFYLKGVALHDGENWSLFSTADGLPSTVLWSLAEPRPGVLWAGTSAGLWELTLESRPPKTFVEFQKSLYTATAQGEFCQAGKPSSPEAGAKLRLGLRDFSMMPEERCVLMEQPFTARDTPQLEFLGQTPWSLEAAERLWFSVRIDDQEAGPFLPITSYKLPELPNGLHRIELRTKNRWLRLDPIPLRFTLELNRPLSPWIWTTALSLTALALFLLRTRIRDLLLAIWNIRYRPIPPNPYTPRSPAQGELFVGRGELIEQLLDVSESRVLLGPPRLGKTSLLGELQRRASPGGQIIIASNIEDWLQENFAGMVSNVLQKLGATPSDGAALRQLDQFLEARAETRILWIIDHFHRIEELLAHDATPVQQVLLALRSLLQRHRHFGLVVALTGRREDLERRYTELFAFSRSDLLKPLTQEEAAELCQKPLAGSINYTSAALDRIYTLTGGHPAVLQEVLAALIDEMSRAKKNLCRVQFLRQVETNILDRLVFVQAWWQTLNRAEQLVMARLAEKVEPGQDAEIQEFVAQEAQSLGLLPQEIRKALAACQETELLGGDEQTVDWSSELVHCWVRKNQKFKNVLERELIQLGPYELLSKIGQGGMGAVYRARHMTGGETVAVKVLHSSALEDDESRQRFFREADIGVKLRHENIVRIYERGETGAQAFIAMELLEGVTLRAFLHDKGPMPAVKAMKVLRSIADALSAIHQLGIIHRDIKTENIFLSISGKKANPKLMDFGLARSESSRVTRSGVIVGTVAYMSPEQALGQPLGPETDLYSLGVVLFEMLTAQTPFRGSSDVAILSQIVHRPAPDIVQLRPDLPARLAELLQRLLAKEPAARPRSAQEVVAEVEAILNESSGSAEG